jgi:cytochrome c553
MRSCVTYLAFLAWPAAAVCAETPSAAAFAPADIAFFEAKVRPLLAGHCYSCHSAKAKRPKGGLRLDSRAAALRGGDSGPAFVPGQPEKSLLLEAVRYRSEALQMPPKGKLAERDIAVLEEWLRRGAPFPPDKTAKLTREGPLLTEGRGFWSFRVPQASARPALKNAGWPRRDIDAFLLAELEKRGLGPAPAATRQVLIRRATFDLTGLPPTPTQVQEFTNDKAPDAYARLVDRLLASPQYGERWGRFWLDLARYCDIAEPWAECKGQPYLFRDWVVQAFNDDVPYNQFVMQQLAADLIPGGKPADRAALGFLGLSPSYWKELKLDPVVIQTVVAEEWEERIHALTSTFLGLTVACARCHDHKFDPITTADYYALAGVLASTRLADRDLLPDAQARQVQLARQRVQDLETKIRTLEEKKPTSADAKKSIAGWKAEIAAIKKATPRFDAPMAAGVTEASLLVLPDGPHRTRLEYKAGMAQNVAMQVRGNPGNRGPVVPRRFLSVLSPDPPAPFANGSGRLELARALVAEGAPLTARVIVNRVWKHHFGAGLVETPSDFGSQGERPSHPELLDDLTARFIHNGWSIKCLHREIMLSAAYQQASLPEAAERAQALDPANRLLWRMNRRRLEVEAWRDAMLAVSGTLDVKVGGPPMDLGDVNNQRRTLYGTVKRRELNDLLRMHDFPDPVAHSPNRLPTTTPLQQLFVLNSPFMRQQATALVRRLKREVPRDNEERVRRAYNLLFSRTPTPEQVRWATEFLNAESPQLREQAWEQYAQALLGSNEFLYVD